MKATLPTVGQPYTIPVGTPVHSTRTGKWAPSKRKQTIPVPHITAYSDGTTTVRWPGEGGYWRTVVIDAGRYVTRVPGERP